MTTSTMRSTSSSTRNAVTSMYVGLVLTLAVAIVPVLAEGQLVSHLRWVYEGYQGPAGIEETTSVVLTYLFVIAGLGVVTWLGSIWAVRRQKRWARVIATLVLVIASSLALLNLLAEEYEKNLLPTLIGFSGLVPCLAGLVAVGFLWMPDRGSSRGEPQVL